MTVLSYSDHTDLVPYPLPLENGETEEEEHQRLVKVSEEKKKDREYEETSRGVPAKFGERVLMAAGDAYAKTQEMMADMELSSARKKMKKDASERLARFEEHWPALAADGEKPVAWYSCSAWNARSRKSMPGRMIFTQKHILFTSEEGNFNISWKDILSLQKAVELPSYPPHDPFFLPIPVPDAEWGALMVYCARGRLYHFHKIRGGTLLRTNHSITLNRCFLNCDRLWRDVVSVVNLVDERSDYAKKLHGFDYTCEWLSPILASGAVKKEEEEEEEELES